MSLSPGTRLGRYTISAPLDAGAMGRVYRAVDSTLDRVVAIRVLALPFRDDADFRHRLRRDAAAAAALTHANIATLYAIEEVEGNTYLVMEFVEGESLRKKLSHGPLPLAEALAYGKQIADALAAAHDHGLIHRDLKPENIIVKPDGEVKILDFGLAKALAVERPARSTEWATEPGLIIGSVAYMSPEQARGAPVGPASDVFTLGAVLYEMLSGRRAFAGDSAADVLAKVLVAEPPPIPGLPAEVDRVLRLCLRRDPAERVFTARELSWKLEELKTAPRSTPVTRQPRRRAMALVATGTLGALTIVLALVSTVTSPRFATETRPAAWVPPEFVVARTPPALGALDVAVTPLSSCPVPGRCAITFHTRVLGVDPGSLTFSWSGCATGSGPTVTCRVDGPEIARATVTVSDGATGQRASVSSSATSRVVSVFFATDRRPSKARTGVVYSGGRNDDVPDADALHYGLATVSIPPEHEIGAIERPIRVWRWEEREDTNRHFVLLDGAERSERVFFSDLADRVNTAERREAFIFVHGFRVGFEDAIRRTAQLHADLRFAGIPILYSWPSAGRLAANQADYESARWSRPHFARFLKDVARRSGATTLYIIAHSMGAWATVNALDALAGEAGTPGAPRFREVVLAAPDVDAGVFRQLSSAMKASAERVTLYAASQDHALRASKTLRSGYPRAGEAGENLLVVSGVDTVDSSAVVDEDTDVLDHSYFGDARSVLGDIATLLRHGDPPGVRFGLVTKRKGTLDYWAFVPSAIPLWVIRWVFRIVAVLMTAVAGYLVWRLVRRAIRLWSARVA